MIELWEEEFQKANDDEEHDLNLHKSVIESEFEIITENKKNDGENVKHGQDKLGAENGRNKPEGNGTKDDETVNSGKSKDRTFFSRFIKGRNNPGPAPIMEDPNMSSIASGMSEFDDIEHLMYRSTYIKGEYINDGLLSINNRSKNKKLLYRYDDWINLLQMKNNWFK